MTNYCSECIHLDWKNKDSYSSKSQYYCRERGKYFEPRDWACRYFIEDKSKQVINQDCYITTIVCNILGYDDNCELLNILRNFRENTLKTNPMYLPILIEYDIVGPLISEHIKSEKNNQGIAAVLLKTFLLPCAKLIKENKIDEAIEIYVYMVNYLKDEYEIITSEIIIPENIDIENLGKGRIRTKKTSECY